MVFVTVNVDVPLVTVAAASVASIDPVIVLV